ncbi:MAG: PEGA domain protein [Microgenomates bacterium OLB22]|nr:MAG: PEGA domain protein [Microgenomates bacterium OLB22]
MKSKIVFLLILVAGFLTAIVLSFFFLKSRSQNGVLKVLSSPLAKVIINGKELGTTSLEKTYPVGSYTLRLEPVDTSTNAIPWEGTIDVYSNARTEVEQELGLDANSSSGIILTVRKSDNARDKGLISVDTDPKGALVLIDGEEVGISPLQSVEAEQGIHEITIVSSGFFRKQKKVRVEKGYEVIAYFKLAVDSSVKKIDELSAASGSAGLQVATSSAKSISPTPTRSTTPTPQTTASASTGGSSIEILDTPTGWLRVRVEPSTTASEAAKVNPGEKYVIAGQQTGWYKIEYKKGLFGWISSSYAKKVE